MSKAPELSSLCGQSLHARCPHRAAVQPPWPWRRRPVGEVVLCRCSCHAGCPLAGKTTAAREAWAAACTCAGAEEDMFDHPDAAEIESRLHAVFEEHGRPLPLPRIGTSTGYRAVGVGTVAATLLTAAAVASTGRRRLAFSLAAAGAWLLSGYAVALVTTVTQTSRAAEGHSRVQDLPSR